MQLMFPIDNLLFLATLVMLASWILTWVIRRYALAKNIIDHPNHRSSHSVPTPRGGGLAFVFVFLMILAYLYFQGVVINRQYVLIGAGLFLALLGFLDDRGHIGAGWRLLGHFFASILALHWIDGMPPVHIVAWTIQAGFLLNCLAVLYLVWLLNLYNFMDGIDGLASIEAVCVCIGMAMIYAMTRHDALIALPLILSAAVLGFLYWNFPPARIFMGDAGSGFLGFILGILSIQAAKIDPQFFWSWLILLGVFIVDATLTLLCRLIRGKKIHEAHRTHAFQHAAVHYQSHLKVTLFVLGFNIIWLWPLAWIVGLGYLDGFLGVCIAYAPLLGLALKFKAGRDA